MTSRLTQRSLMGAALAALALLLAPGCAKHVATGAQPCPCADGYICCSSGICAQTNDQCDEATFALSAQAVGQWTGYVENYTGLASGADSLKLVFDVAADGTFEGRATLGDAAPPAPPTDPNAVWPPGLSEPSLVNVGEQPVEGFVYEAHDIAWEARRLKFTIQLSAPWKPWCELQTSYNVEAPVSFAWRCVPGYGPQQDDGTCLFYVPNDETAPPIRAFCRKFEMCQKPGQPCLCDATGCTAGTVADPPGSVAKTASFDIALKGDEGDGSFSADGATNNIRLVRASH